MNHRLGIRKTTAIGIAILLLITAGLFAGSTVTAWAFPNDGTVSSDNVNVRESAVDGTPVGAVNAGQSVTVLDSTDGSDGMTWYEIQYDANGSQITGWVREDFLQVEESAEEEEPVAEESGTTAEASTETEPNLVVASAIPSDVVPSGFQLTTINYEGADISALVMNNAEVYLLYMEDTAGLVDGRFVIYDQERAELLPFIEFETADDGFIVLLNIPDDEVSVMSDRFTMTTCSFAEGTMDALQMTEADAAIASDADISDFYYMYGVNRDGDYGWYAYDADDGTIQENIFNISYGLDGALVDALEEDTGVSLDSLSRILLIVIIAVVALLVILVIVLGVRCSRLKKQGSKKSSPHKGHSSKAAKESAEKEKAKKESRRAARRREEEEYEQVIFADYQPTYDTPPDALHSTTISQATRPLDQLVQPEAPAQQMAQKQSAQPQQPIPPQQPQQPIPPQQPQQPQQSIPPQQPQQPIPPQQPQQPIPPQQPAQSQRSAKQAKPVDDDDLEFL